MAIFGHSFPSVTETKIYFDPLNVAVRNWTHKYNV